MIGLCYLIPIILGFLWGPSFVFLAAEVSARADDVHDSSFACLRSHTGTGLHLAPFSDPWAWITRGTRSGETARTCGPALRVLVVNDSPQLGRHTRVHQDSAPKRPDVYAHTFCDATYRNRCVRTPPHRSVRLGVSLVEPLHQIVSREPDRKAGAEVHEPPTQPAKSAMGPSARSSFTSSRPGPCSRRGPGWRRRPAGAS